jgi:hypothetical protein
VLWMVLMSAMALVALGVGVGLLGHSPFPALSVVCSTESVPATG